MRNRAFAIILILVILSGVVVWPRSSSAAPHTPQEVPDTIPPFMSQYYQETQHASMNSFLAFWRRTPNALFVLGYPISQPFIEESFTNPGEFYRVQYFQRAVLEEHPENFGKDGNRFYILGRLMGSRLAEGRTESAFQKV